MLWYVGCVQVFYFLYIPPFPIGMPMSILVMEFVLAAHRKIEAWQVARFIIIIIVVEYENCLITCQVLQLIHCSTYHTVLYCMHWATWQPCTQYFPWEDLTGWYTHYVRSFAGNFVKISAPLAKEVYGSFLRQFVETESPRSLGVLSVASVIVVAAQDIMF